MISKIIPVFLMAMLSVLSAPLYSNAYGATMTVSAEEEADLLYMREEEKLARDTYLTLADEWNLAVFSNIAGAEQKHMDALLKLLKKYNLPDPAASTAIGEFTNSTLQNLYNTLLAMGKQSSLNALKVGGIIEETDMRDINAAIERSQKEDIDLVYESLVCGSRNHLRGFAQNIVAATGTAYVAQVISQTEVDQILQSPMEKCGKNK
jgi:hypothetical protein